MRSQYEEEKENLLLETNKKLEEFKQKIVNNSDQSKKIASLESSLREFQKQK
jgi:hypothetical protein